MTKQRVLIGIIACEVVLIALDLWLIRNTRKHQYLF